MDQILKDLLIPGIPIVEKIIRPIIVYVFLIIGLRLAGKRELAQLNPFDLVVLLTLSNTVQNAIIGSDNSLSGGIIGAIALLSVNYALVRFIHKFHKFEAIIQGKPTVLVDKGEIQWENMHKELICEDELLATIHRQGIENVDQVEKAVLESSGAVSVIVRHPTPEEAADKEIAERLTKIEALLQNLVARPA